MKVPKKMATDIVDRMKEIINQDINYIDVNGTIIASTDDNRVGTFHGGAQKVVNIKEKVIISKEGEFKGAKEGINLPVYFERNIIGVIGITGSEKEVSKYGKIIQNMTEILIKEAYVKEQENFERESKKQIMEELLFRTHNEKDKKVLEEHSELLGIKLTLKRIVLVARISENHKNEIQSTPHAQESVYNYITQYLNFDSQNLVVQFGMNYVITLNLVGINDGVFELIKRIHNRIQEKYHINVCFGIGCESTSIEELRTSYLEAKSSLNAALSSKGNFITKYSDLNIELLIEEIPDSVKIKYVKSVFNHIEEKKLEQYKTILTKYFDNNGSITKTAGELFLHKNTLQYKLKKVRDLTGYDPREIEGIVIIYIAIKLMESLEFQSE